MLRALLEGVVDCGYVFKVDDAAVVGAHGEVEHLGGFVKLTLHAQREGIAADIEGSARYVSVFGGDDSGYALHRHVVGLQFVGVAVDVDLTLRGA